MSGAPCLMGVGLNADVAQPQEEDMDSRQVVQQGLKVGDVFLSEDNIPGAIVKVNARKAGRFTYIEYLVRWTHGGYAWVEDYQYQGTNSIMLAQA